MPVAPMPALVGQASPWIEHLARLGYAAKGVLYLTAGGLAAAFALGNGGQADVDTRTALERVLHVPLGRPLLAVIAAGLLGVAIWRVLDGAKGIEHPGHSAKAIAHRVKSIGIAIIHLGLAWTAASLALWQRGDAADDRAQHWTSRALATPGGRYAVYGIAIAILAYGVVQVFRAITAKLDRRLDLSRLSAAARHKVVQIARFGIAARGIVFGTIGVLLWRAARDHAPREAGGIGKSMSELVDLGRGPFLAIALGLAAYGIYELLQARFRRLDVR
jgi:hypothetical protein